MCESGTPQSQMGGTVGSVLGVGRMRRYEEVRRGRESMEHQSGARDRSLDRMIVGVSRLLEIPPW